MEVTIVENGQYDRNLTITVPAAEVETRYRSEIQRLSTQVKIPGFRPGKVPLKVVESRYRDAILAEIAEKLFNETYPKALQDKSLVPVAGPQISLEKLQLGEDFSYQASIQIFPEMKPQGYKGMSLSRIEVEVTDDDVTEIIEGLREKFADQAAEDGRAAENGDEVLLDFEGFVDGVAFDGGKSGPEGHPLVLGSNQFIPGFEEQLLGVQAGDAKDVEVSFPENYNSEDLAGKEAIFKCTIREVRVRTLPEVDAEFAKKFGQEGDDALEKLKQEIVNRLKEQSKVETDKRVRQQVLDQLLKANAMELPSQMIDREVKSLVERTKQDMKQQGQDPEQVTLDDEQWRTRFDKMANERVILGLVIGAVARDESLEADDAAVDAYLETVDAQYGAGMSQYIKQNKEQLEEIKGTVLEQQVIEFIEAQGEVATESMGYKAFMNPEPEEKKQDAGEAAEAAE